jgi:Zn-dependent peptidase ImmA (M78 family)
MATRVREAMQATGLSQQSLATAIGLDPTAMSKSLSGKRRFTSLELAGISEVTGTAIGDLIGIAEDDRVRLSARTQPEGNPALTSALRRVNEFLVVDEDLVDLGLDTTASPLPFGLRDGKPVPQGEALAEEARAWAGLEAEDIEELASFCESELMIDVAVEPLPDGLDGLSICRGDYRLALISSTIPATRQRYTLAHEIGHLVAGDGDGMVVDENVFGASNIEEVRANAFAAAFLMPASSLRQAVGSDEPSDQAIGRMLIRYKVSLEALAFRLHNVGLVNAAGRDRILALSARKLALLSGRSAEYYRQLQDHGHRRLPSGLVTRALEAYQHGDLDVAVLTRLTGIDAAALVAQLGPAPSGYAKAIAPTR